VSRELALEAFPAVAERLPDGALSPRSLLVVDEERRTVEAALDRLPPDFKTVVLLRSREHYAFVEIGDFMNRSADAARKLWFRAIERLQHELQATDEDL
jgi:RNA polymerase sigma-70 factor (ECF subfamily)